MCIIPLPDISQVLKGQLRIPRDTTMHDKYFGVDEVADWHPTKHLTKKLKHELIRLCASSVLGKNFSLVKVSGLFLPTHLLLQTAATSREIQVNFG